MTDRIIKSYWVYFSLFAVSGLSGLIYESIWTHYLKTFLGHASYAQALVLIIFMGGMSIGAFSSNFHLKKTKNAIKSYAYIEIAIGIYGLLFHNLYQSSTETVFTLISTYNFASNYICNFSFFLSDSGLKSFFRCSG